MSATGRVIGLGLATGVAFGMYLGLLWQALWIGAALGAGTAVTVTLALWRSWGVKGLAGLTFDQRHHVLRTLRQGQAMDDPQLLAAHWQCGNAVLAKPHSPAIGYTVSGILAVLLGTSVVIGLVTSGPGSLIRDLPLLVMFVTVFSAMHMSRRYREQVARSMNATAALVNQPV